MYALSRLLLMVAVLAGLYALAVLVVVAWPGSGIVLAVLAVSRIKRRGRGRLTTLGSARWASEADLRRAGMLNAPSGLILGRLP